MQFECSFKSFHSHCPIPLIFGQMFFATVKFSWHTYSIHSVNWKLCCVFSWPRRAITQGLLLEDRAAALWAVWLWDMRTVVSYRTGHKAKENHRFLRYHELPEKPEVCHCGSKNPRWPQEVLKVWLLVVGWNRTLIIILCYISWNQKKKNKVLGQISIACLQKLQKCHKHICYL